MTTEHHYVSWKKNEMICMVELDRTYKRAMIIDKFHNEKHPNF